MMINIFKFSDVRYYILCEFLNYIYNDIYYKEFNDALDDDSFDYKFLLTSDEWITLCFKQLNKSGLSIRIITNYYGNSWQSLQISF